MIKLLLAFLLIPSLVLAAPPTRDNNYVTQTTIRSADVSANENAIFSYLQSGVDTFADNSIVNADINSSAAINYSKLNLSNGIINSDISSSAAISYSKLNLTGAILNADLAGSISDSKLNAIVSTSKVGGTALTSLASIPSGAGVIPIANLASGTPNGSKFIRDDGTLQSIGMILVSNTAVSSASNTGDISITAGKYYKVIFQLGALSAADTILIRFNSDTTATAYNYSFSGNTTTGAISGGAATASAITVGTSVLNGSAEYTNGDFTITPDATSRKYIFGKMSYRDSAGSLFTFVDASGAWTGSTPTTSFEILTSGGATMSGNVLLYELGT